MNTSLCGILIQFAHHITLPVLVLDIGSLAHLMKANILMLVLLHRLLIQ